MSVCRDEAVGRRGLEPERINESASTSSSICTLVSEIKRHDLCICVSVCLCVCSCIPPSSFAGLKEVAAEVRNDDSWLSQKITN